MRTPSRRNRAVIG
jgi:hypothetical protein